jgi:hypothetical protein
LRRGQVVRLLSCWKRWRHIELVDENLSRNRRARLDISPEGVETRRQVIDMAGPGVDEAALSTLRIKEALRAYFKPKTRSFECRFCQTSC